MTTFITRGTSINIKAILLISIIGFSPALICQSFPGTNGLTIGAGVGAFANYLGPVVSIGYNDKDMLAEATFIYGTSIISEDPGLYNHAKPGGVTLNLSYIPNIGSSGAFKFVFGFGTMVIKEETGKNYYPPKDGLVGYAQLFSGTRYYFTRNIYFQAQVGYGFVTEDGSGLLTKEKLGEYENGLTAQVAAMFVF